MIDLSNPEGIKAFKREMDSALKLRQAITDESIKIHKLFVGDAYRKWGNQNLDNHAFKWVTTVRPQLVHGTPVVKVTDRGIETEQTTELGKAQNECLRLNGFLSETKKVAHDLQFDFGVMMTTLEPTPGYIGDPQFVPHWPVAKRISPRMYFRDTETPTLGKPRFEGHRWVMTRDELIECKNPDGSPMYDEQALLALKTTESIEEVRKALMSDGMGFDGKPDDFVVGYTVYIHATRKLVRLAFTSGSDAVVLKEEEEFRLPMPGPYTLFGIYWPADQVYPLAPLAVVMRQMEEINRHRKQAADDADTLKRLTIVDSAQNGVVANVKDAASNSVLSIPGFTGRLATIDVGGASKDQLAYIEWGQDNLEKLSSLASFIQGEVGGKGSTTATEIAEASAWANMKVKDVQEEFQSCLTDVLTRMATAMDETEGVMFPYTTQTPDGRTVEATWIGGDGTAVGQPTQKTNSPWKRQLRVKIEPYTLPYVSQTSQLQRIMQVQAQTLNILAAQAKLPAVQGKAMLADLSNALNTPGSADKYVNWELQDALTQAQMVAAAAPALMAAGGGMAPPPEDERTPGTHKQGQAVEAS
jgi:hypothetical protein